MDDWPSIDASGTIDDAAIIAQCGAAMIHEISLSTMRHYDTKTSSFVNILKNFP